MDIKNEINEIRKLKLKSDLILMDIKGGVGSGKKGHKTAKKEKVEYTKKLIQEKIKPSDKFTAKDVMFNIIQEHGKDFAKSLDKSDIQDMVGSFISSMRKKK